MPNYKKMSALDDHGRTAAALEHKFRKWRHISRDILAAHPEEAGTDQAVGQPAQPKKSRSPKKQISGPNNNNDDSEDEASKPKVIITFFLQLMLKLMQYRAVIN